MDGSLAYQRQVPEEEVFLDGLDILSDEGEFELLVPLMEEPFCRNAEKRFMVANEEGNWHSIHPNSWIKFILRNKTDMSAKIVYATADLKVKARGVMSAIITAPAELAGFICAPLTGENCWVVVRPMNIQNIHKGLIDFSKRDLDERIADLRAAFLCCVNLPFHEEPRADPSANINLADQVLFTSKEAIGFFNDVRGVKQLNYCKFGGFFNVQLDDDSLVGSEVFVLTSSNHGWPSSYTQFREFDNIMNQYGEYTKGVIERLGEGYIFRPYKQVSNPEYAGNSFYIERS